MASPRAAAGPAATWRTPANALTALRLLAAPLLAWALLAGAPGAAALLFALAVASDLLDGPLARRRGEATPLGGLLDHATDAALNAAGLAALAWTGPVPAPLPLLVALAFAQYALDSRAARGRPLRASALGRWNGIAYFVLLGLGLAHALGLPAAPGAGLLRALGWALVATTALSMADRARALWRLRGER